VVLEISFGLGTFVVLRLYACFIIVDISYVWSFDLVVFVVRSTKWVEKDFKLVKVLRRIRYFRLNLCLFFYMCEDLSLSFFI